jgi:hypothetical protein
MKKIHIITLAALIMGFAACQNKDETKPSSNNNTTPPKKSKLELLCQTWTLDETYEDGTRKTTGGTDKYQYTRQGQFKFYYNGSWMEIGTYDFTSKDSTAISVLFGSTPTIMALKTLDEKNLKTEFTSGGKKLNYNYKR